MRRGGEHAAPALRPLPALGRRLVRDSRRPPHGDRAVVRVLAQGDEQQARRRMGAEKQERKEMTRKIVMAFLGLVAGIMTAPLAALAWPVCVAVFLYSKVDDAQP